MRRLLAIGLVLLAGCSTTTSTQHSKPTQAEELSQPGSPLRKSLEKAAAHLPPGSSVEEQTAQALREAR